MAIREVFASIFPSWLYLFRITLYIGNKFRALIAVCGQFRSKNALFSALFRTQADLAIEDLDGDCRQTSTYTRAMDTQAGIRLEQGTMQATLNEAFIDIHKLIWRPVEINAGMGTAIPECVYLLMPVDQKSLAGLERTDLKTVANTMTQLANRNYHMRVQHSPL